jgi:hypothetical protein
MATWQPMASIETRAPTRSSRSIKAGMAVISLDFSNTAFWPSTSRLSEPRRYRDRVHLESLTARNMVRMSQVL